MALNKVYWDYDNAQSVDWATYGMKYANKQIYANPNFSWGNLDYSFPTSFRKRNITRLKFTGNGQSQACETIPDCLIYNSMIAYPGASATGSFYKDNYWSYYSAGSEGFFPVIDIDTHDFAFKMTLALFSNGNWITVNAVDFVNSYDNYDANVYGYINNYIESPGSRYTFCNYYVTEDSQFSVHANIYGYRTSGYGSVNQGGHAVSGQTAWSNRSIWQLAATTAGNYSSLSYPANSYFPYEIPELAGQSWNAGNQTAPAAIITGGIYTNHAVLTYSDQRVYMPLKHILKDIIVNSGLVLLDSNNDKWISMVDGNGLCQDKLVLLSSDEAKESSIYNTRTSDNNLNPEPPEPPSGSDEDEDTAITTNGAPFGTGLAHYYVTTVDSVTLQHISEAMSTWDIDGTKKDLYKNLISCKIIKPPAGIPSTSGVFTIYGVKPQYNGTDITIPEVTGNPSITFGPYNISRKFNDFRDYAPYSKAEIFIPYCGWTALPSHVIGRSVYVDYFTDVIAGTVKAVIRCGNNAVAEAAGVMAVDIPFAAQNVGAKIAAATTGMLSYGQGALQASVGIGQAVATKGKSGIKNITSGLASVIGAYNQMAMVNNENWTEINGKSGDGCALAGIDTIIIKITRPKYGSYAAPYYVPADYGHTVGFVSMKKTTVGSCTGLIICDNADTSGISGATDRERQLIKEYLESGVIVRHPE